MILISGPRQVGKSTLSFELRDQRVLLDDVGIRESVQKDPVLFIKNLKKPTCLDEIQKAPELLEAIKIYVDEKRSNGDFLLTGSANVLDMNAVEDTLAGRLIEVTLWPLSHKEINNSLDNLVDLLFSENFIDTRFKTLAPEKIIEKIIAGGYPSAIEIPESEMRSYWFSSYIATYIERDIRDVGEIRNLPQFIKLFNLLAVRSANLLNIKNLANTAALTEATTENYISMLEMIFQIKRLPPYSGNLSKRLTKTPKIYFTDSGVLSHLLNIQTFSQWMQNTHSGALLETFVFSELVKFISYSAKNIGFYHYRTTDQKEIDFILEYNGRIVALEVKSSSKITNQDFKHLLDLKNHCKAFHLGIVFYLGDNVLPFGERLFAVPIAIFF